MNNRVSSIGFLAIALLFFSSCKNGPSGKSHGPIVLGDSSMIVTEKDPKKLQDLVIDLNPVIKPSAEEPEKTEQAQPSARDTTEKTKTAESNQQQSMTGPGVKADFTEVSVMIPNVEAKISGTGDLHKKNDAVYTLTDGTLNGNTLKVSGNVTKVSQRYQVVVLLKSSAGIMPLESLTNTTSWETVNGSNGQYHITGLDSRSLETPDVDAGDIREAVKKAALRRHMSRKKMQELESTVHHTRSVRQKPLSLVLRSVMWKIDGKDASGKNFSKQIRIDIPI